MAVFREVFLSENDFQAVLAHFCCYAYDSNSSEAVGKIATNQKDCHRCFFGVKVYCIAKAYHQNNSKKNWFVRYQQRS